MANPQARSPSRQPRRPVARALLACFLVGLAACTTGAVRPDDVRAPFDQIECDGPRVLQVVAHQDDDILFMSPTLLRHLDAEHCIRTVYLTAGDAGDGLAYQAGREAGIEAAYANMVGLPNLWVEHLHTYEGHLVRVLALVDAPRVSLVFLGLPDGRTKGQGFERFGFASLEKLWRNELPTLTSVDARNIFTREGLIGVLAAIMEAFDPTLLALLDPMRFHGNEHSDHAFSARFAYLAQERLVRAPRIDIYRDYNISDEPINIAAADQQTKWSSFVLYAEHDLKLCRDAATCLANSPYFLYSQREYVIRDVLYTGSLRNDGACLTVIDHAAAAGDSVALAPCQDVPSQAWALTRAGELRGLGGRCLRLAGASPSAPYLASCAEPAVAHAAPWSRSALGQLSARGQCLAAAQEGQRVIATPCTDPPSSVQPNQWPANTWAFGEF